MSMINGALSGVGNLGALFNFGNQGTENNYDASTQITVQPGGTLNYTGDAPETINFDGQGQSVSTSGDATANSSVGP